MSNSPFDIPIDTPINLSVGETPEPIEDVVACSVAAHDMQAEEPIMPVGFDSWTPPLLSDSTLGKARILLVTEYPGQELIDFIPLLDNCDRGKVSAVAINLQPTPYLHKANQCFHELGLADWSFWNWPRPPRDQIGVIRRLADFIQDLEPEYVFAGHENSAVPSALATWRPARRTPVRPQLYTTYAGGLARGPVALTTSLEGFAKYSALYDRLYGSVQRRTLNSMQTYVLGAE